MELEDEADVFVAEACELVAGEPQHVLAGNFHCPGVGFVERSHDLQQGGFSCSAGSDDADYLVGLDVEVYAFEHFERAEGFVDVA